MHIVGVPEWTIAIVQAMSNDARSKIRVNDSSSDEFDVKSGVHQGLVLSPLPFNTVMEALSREFETSCSWEPLYADDLVLIAETFVC